MGRREKPLTPAQLSYLDAFDRFLRADNTPERRFYRGEMGERLNLVLAEVNLPLPEDIRWQEKA